MPWWVLLGALAGVVALLVVRTIRKDRREYQRFKRYSTTSRRQAMYATWLRESFATFGGITVGVLALAADREAAFLAQAQSWGWVAATRDWIAANPWIVAAALGAVALGFAVLTVVGVVSARRHPEDLIALGDIRALLPRNRDELAWTAALSVNAGLVEELAFRLAIPLLVFGASGSAVLAIAGSVLLFGALHAYQGAAGVATATVIGGVLMLVFVLSGTILLPMLLHALFDLRSLVLIPTAVSGVHRVDGTVRPVRAAIRTS